MHFFFPIKLSLNKKNKIKIGVLVSQCCSLMCKSPNRAGQLYRIYWRYTNDLPNLTHKKHDTQKGYIIYYNSKCLRNFILWIYLVCLNWIYVHTVHIFCIISHKCTYRIRLGFPISEVMVVVVVGVVYLQGSPNAEIDKNEKRIALIIHKKTKWVEFINFGAVANFGKWASF